MHNGKYISVKRVLENVHRNFNLGEEINFYDALEWIGALLSLANSPFTLDKHIKVINIEDGRGKLPCDLHSIIQCGRRRSMSTSLGSAPRTFFMENSVVEENEEYLPDTSDIYIETSVSDSTYYLEPMYYSADSHLLRYHLLDIDHNVDPACGNTYQVNKNHIFTNFENGLVEMAYLRIPLDDEGFPLIPDDETWIKACEYEIAYRILFRNLIVGEGSDQKIRVFNIVERDREHYFASAVNKSKMPTQDMAATWQQHALNYIKSPSNHAAFFKHIHEPGGYKTSRR